MKKWIIILLVVGIGSHFGWMFLLDHFEKKGIPKSHLFGYLIYGRKYLGDVPSHMTGRKTGKDAENDSKKIAKEVAKKAAEKKKALPKTKESIKKEYNAKLKKAFTEKEKIAAHIHFYEEMLRIEKDLARRKEYKNKYSDLSAKEFAKNKSEVTYKAKLEEYNDVKQKIATYRKNGVRPPAKLVKMQKNKPDKEKIYKSLYQKEKTRLLSAIK